MKKDIILEIYKDIRTVFRLNDIAMLVGDTDFVSLKKKLNYYVSKEKLGNPRKGIYTKPDYNLEELICVLYTPSYISLEYVLQQAGVIFQYDPHITAISYLSRTVEIESQICIYHKMKGEILVNILGVNQSIEGINIASPERAFLDSIYLYKNYYVDNLHPLNKKIITRLLPVYGSQSLIKRVNQLFKND